MTPAVDLDRFHTAGKLAAKQAHKLGYGKIEEPLIAVRFQIGRQPAAEIGFDPWPAERPELVSAGAGPILAAKDARVSIELFGVVERHEEFVGESEWQPLCGLNFCWQRWREAQALRC